LLIQRRTSQVLVDADLDTLATAPYVRTDDLLKASPDRAPARPRVGIAPRISDAELVTLAVMQALLGPTSEARWLRTKRLRRPADTLRWLIGMLARDTDLWTDDVWVVDSTPVECARFRETVHRSALAGWAEYGYCASHSRWFWGCVTAPTCTPTCAATTGCSSRCGRRPNAPMRCSATGGRSTGSPSVHGASASSLQPLLL
jgi:hypothetical protein